MRKKLRSAMEEKVRENRLRRMAKRQGYTVTKVRRIDRRALDHGTYAIEQIDSGLRRGMLSLDMIEAFLTEDVQRKREVFFRPTRKGRRL